MRWPSRVWTFRGLREVREKLVDRSLIDEVAFCSAVDDECPRRSLFGVVKQFSTAIT